MNTFSCKVAFFQRCLHLDCKLDIPVRIKRFPAINQKTNQALYSTNGRMIRKLEKGSKLSKKRIDKSWKKLQTRMMVIFFLFIYSTDGMVTMEYLIHVWTSVVEIHGLSNFFILHDCSDNWHGALLFFPFTLNIINNRIVFLALI